MQRKCGSGKADWFFFTCITKNCRGAEYCNGAYIRESDVLFAIRQELQAMQPQCLAAITQHEDKIAEIKETLHGLTDMENIQMLKRQKAYEQYITGRYMTEEYKKAVSEIPLLTLQIDQLHAELERLEEIQKMLNSRISALCCQSVFESLIKHQLLQVVVSGGVVSEVIFCQLKSNYLYNARDYCASALLLKMENESASANIVKT